MEVMWPNPCVGGLGATIQFTDHPAQQRALCMLHANKCCLQGNTHAANHVGMFIQSMNVFVDPYSMEVLICFIYFSSFAYLHDLSVFFLVSALVCVAPSSSRPLPLSTLAPCSWKCFLCVPQRGGGGRKWQAGDTHILMWDALKLYGATSALRQHLYPSSLRIRHFSSIPFSSLQLPPPSFTCDRPTDLRYPFSGCPLPETAWRRECRLEGCGREGKINVNCVPLMQDICALFCDPNNDRAFCTGVAQIASHNRSARLVFTSESS